MKSKYWLNGTTVLTVAQMTKLLGDVAESLGKPRPAETTIRLWKTELGGIKLDKIWVFVDPDPEKLKTFLLTRPKRGRKRKSNDTTS